MSYWGNEFMPALEAMPYGLIKELAKLSDYSEKYLREQWHEEFEDEWLYWQESGDDDVFTLIEKVCERVKWFVGFIRENEL